MTDKYHIWTNKIPMSEVARVARRCGTDMDILAVTPHDMDQMLNWALEEEEYELAAKLHDKLETMNTIIKQIKQNEELQNQ